MRTRSSLLLVALVATLLPTAAGAAVPMWAPADQATIRPGVEVVTDGAQCTSNFIFLDGDDVLLGMAAHCAATGDDSSQTDGCLAGVNAVGIAVDVEGAEHAGTMVYNAWATMQQRGETDANACRFNDLALVRLDPRDHARVNPTFQGWGGPLAISPGAVAGERAYTYGRSSLRPGFSTKEGSVDDRESGGWTYTVSTTSNPGIPGDSGSGFLDQRGHAFGVLSTVELFPQAGTNGVTDLRMALDYAAANAGFQVVLATGTEPFTPTGETATSPTDPPIDEEPTPGDDAPPAERVAGQDRYATADAVAGGTDRAEVVWIATGTAPADALAAGPIAGRQDAPLLLAGPNGLSAATLAQVRRLRASRAVIVGGPAAVPTSVEGQLRTAGVTTVDRLAGNDRYQTAATISATATTPGRPVMIANGRGFADALGAVPFIAATGGTLLLTDTDRLPEATARQLRDADASSVLVLGGPTAISDAQLTAIADASGVMPERIAGQDRYATGVAATRSLAGADGFAFDGRVWLASGATFPDALAGGPAVAATNGLLVLVPPTGPVPALVVDLVAELAPSSLVVLGGTVAISDDVVAAIRASAD